MVSMNLSTRECDGRAVAGLRGELDVADVAAVAGREQAVIVDLAGLEFIDSSGLAALVLARKQARRAGGDLLLAVPQDPVLRVLAVTRLVGVFSVHASVEQAAGGAGRFRLGPCRWRSGGSAGSAGRSPPGGQEREAGEVSTVTFRKEAGGRERARPVSRKAGARAQTGWPGISSGPGCGCGSISPGACFAGRADDR